MAGKTIPAKETLGNSADSLPSLGDGGSNEIPAWLAVRRKISPSSPIEKEVEHAVEPATELPPTLPLVKPIVISVKQVDSLPLSMSDWLTDRRTIGVVVSLLVHAFVMLCLAFFLVSKVPLRDVVSLWGVSGNTDETAELVLDSVLPVEQMESAPLQLTDLSQALGDSAGNIADAMNIGRGGNGKGEGDGEGTSLSAPTLRIPGHAQTKGSFSAWADPRDPRPGQDYFVVIQIKLPGNVTKYRGSDLSGNVIGTDGFRKTIHFKTTDQFPIENGAIQIRIHIPGAERLVRDTIRVESRLLREKQRFEIEF